MFSKRLRQLALFLVIPAIFIVFAIPYRSGSWMSRIFPPEVKGTITSSGAGGNWTMNVTSCISGIHRGYFGAAFFDDKQSQLGGHVAVQENGDQDIMINTPPSGGSVRLSPGSCSLWDVSMLETGSTRFHPVIMGGHARFRCDFVNPEAHMNGNVDFRFCM